MTGKLFLDGGQNASFLNGWFFVANLIAEIFSGKS
jgi:hypothetical protein